jgi:hypothetical protein
MRILLPPADMNSNQLSLFNFSGANLAVTVASVLKKLNPEILEVNVFIGNGWVF